MGFFSESFFGIFFKDFFVYMDVKLPKNHGKGTALSLKEGDRRKSPRNLIHVVVLGKRDPRIENVVRDVRQWCQDCFLRRREDPQVSRFTDTGKLLRELSQGVQHLEDKYIVVCAGVSKGDILNFLRNIRKEEYLKHLGFIFYPTCNEKAQRRFKKSDRFLSSILRLCFSIETHDVYSALRKAMVRQRIVDSIDIKPIESKESLRSYFALRHKVWNDLGYISEGKVSQKAELELDYTDRYSFPLGAFDHRGNIVGCARLVFPLFDSQFFNRKNLLDLAGEINDPVVSKNFTPPRTLQHPFDILESFEKFGDYYRLLVKERIKKAEVSRVVVHPDYQRMGIGEILVDTLVDLAYSKFQIKELFLACLKDHQPFYEKSGFQLMEGFTCSSFINVRVPAIAMKLSLEGK